MPKAFRHYPLFEVIQLPDHLRLQPLEVKAVERNIWLHDDVDLFFKKTMVPKLKAWAKRNKALSLVLYGSRARGDSKNTSDFDFALVVGSSLTRKQRNRLETELNNELSAELVELRKHQVTGELSLVLLPRQLQDQVLPTIFYAIAEEALLVYDSNSSWKSWLSQISKNIKKYKVRSSNTGKRRVFKWKLSEH